MRPLPPPELAEIVPEMFVPAPEVEDWVKTTFIEEGSLLENPEHAHLANASIGFLWTNVPNVRRGRTILGTCQMMPPHGEPWGAARSSFQIENWFGHMPDFIITLSAPHAFDMEDAEFMALVEHELYHAGQETDIYGSPKFSKTTGQPVFYTRPHDVEQFVGVVRRYGADASGVRELVAAANKGPEISQARISGACGTCLRLVK